MREFFDRFTANLKATDPEDVLMGELLLAVLNLPKEKRQEALDCLLSLTV